MECGNSLNHGYGDIFAMSDGRLLCQSCYTEVLKDRDNKGGIHTLPVSTTPVSTLLEQLRILYPNGHPNFITLTVDEMDLHSRKNHDYSHGGSPVGNFTRVAQIIALYPGIDWTKPQNVALFYMFKQLDAALWMEAKGHTAVVEGQDDRWRDVSVYAKIIRLLLRESTPNENSKSDTKDKL
jgi:hypothetical protein